MSWCGYGRLRPFGLVSGVGLATLLTAIGPARAAEPGSLDRTFSHDGLAFVAMATPGDYEAARAVFKDDRGRYVLAGYSHVADDLMFALARLRPDGRLDPTYGDDGRSLIDPTASKDQNITARLTPNGRVVMLGSRGNASGGIGYVLVRVRTSGALDRSFGRAGVVKGTFEKAATDQAVTDLLVEPDGDLLVLGQAHVNHRTFVIRRHRPDGTLDHGFGDHGRVQGTGMRPGVLLRDGAGRLIVLGMDRPPEADVPEIQARRYSASGTLDTTFGKGGIARIALGRPDVDNVTLRAGAIAGSGRIWMTGTTFDHGTAQTAMLLAAFRPDGRPAAAMDGDGWRTYDVGPVDRSDSIALVGGGRVLLGGGYGESIFGEPSAEPGHLVLMMLRKDGTPDPGFGAGGTVVTEIKHGTHPPGADHAAALSMLVANGRIVVAGVAGGDYHFDFLAARYHLSEH